MLSESVIKKVKQVNVSKNAEKTAARVSDEFSSATKAEKAQIIKRTGQNRNSIYRVKKTGSVSARIILAIAETMNVSPYYLAGATDDKGTYSDETAKAYLLELGYKKLLEDAGSVSAPKKQRKAKNAPVKANAEIEAAGIKGGAEVVETSRIIEDVQSTMFRVTINESDKMREAAKNLDLESAVQLLEALFIRSKAGGNAERLCEVVKHCLLS